MPDHRDLHRDLRLLQLRLLRLWSVQLRRLLQLWLVQLLLLL